MLSDICARPFERLQFVRGTENLFIDLAYGTKEIYTLRDMIHDYNLKHIEMWVNTDVDGVLMMDDWGAQNSLLISPAVWRNFLKPLYREYCDIIHSHDKYVFFHSDGCIEEVYGDLVEIGVDAVNSQLFTMNIEELAKKYRGKITFWGEINRYTLFLGDVQDVVAAVKRVKNTIYDPRGGVIAQCEWGKDNPVENVRAVYETWYQ
jgi:uroporphyrinogen-III decarboxylase